MNAGQRNGSLPTSGSTRICGPPGSGLPGCPWQTESSDHRLPVADPAEQRAVARDRHALGDHPVDGGGHRVDRADFLVRELGGLAGPVGVGDSPPGQGCSTKCSAVS